MSDMVSLIENLMALEIYCCPSIFPMSLLSVCERETERNPFFLVYGVGGWGLGGGGEGRGVGCGWFMQNHDLPIHRSFC